MNNSFRLSDRFWVLARRLIPKPERVHPLGGGRPRVADRRVLAAIFFVLRTGCQWKALDATDLGSGSTAHRRFQEWVRAGFFHRLWRVAARRYYEVRGIGWRWLSIDGCLTKAPLSRSEVVGGGGGGYSGGGGGGPNPVNGNNRGGGGGGSSVASFGRLVSFGNDNRRGNGSVAIYTGPKPASVPEPGSLVLLSFGVLGLAALRRQRRH